MGLHASIKEKAITMFRQMTYCRSEIEYKEIYARFMKEMPLNLKEYFDKNWEKISDMWAGYGLSNTVVYNETTNNKLESKNGQLKTLINSSDDLFECINKLVRFMKDDIDQMKYNKLFNYMTMGKTLEEPNFLKLIRLTNNIQAIRITKSNFRAISGATIDIIYLSGKYATIKIVSRTVA